MSQFPQFEAPRPRLSNKLVINILHDVDLAGQVFGPRANHQTEEARVRYIQRRINAS